MLEKFVEDRYRKSLKECSNEEIYVALLELVKQQAQGKESPAKKKKVYYISAEFLIGKLLSNNLINLGLFDTVKKELEENGKSIYEIEEIEPEPSLGNGGLGRQPAQLSKLKSKGSHPMDGIPLILGDRTSLRALPP